MRGDVRPQYRGSKVIRKRVAEAFDFLSGHLIPHAIAEDKALYPVVCQVMGSASATKTMSRDHVEVGRLTEQLERLAGQLKDGEPSQAERNDLRRILYGLYALVQVHFAKEEEVYLPMLDEKLDEAAATAMFQAMEAAATSEKSKLANT